MADETTGNKETTITKSDDALAKLTEDNNEIVEKPETVEEKTESDFNTAVNETEAIEKTPGTKDEDSSEEDKTSATTTVDGAVAGDDHTGKATESKCPALKGRKPSFNSLRQEHDMLLFARSLLLIVAAIALLIPIPFSYVGLKFVLFVFVSYAAIYNEISIGEEAKMRKDKTSARAHGFAYIAFGAVTVLFFVLAIRAGVAASTMQDALQQCLTALKNAGIPAIVVK